MDSLANTPDPEVPKLLQKKKKNEFWSKVIKWGRIAGSATMFLLILVLFGILYSNRDLPDLVDAQRQQFVKCVNKPVDYPGCQRPIVTQKEIDKAKDGRPGLPGLPGARGPRGLQGETGSRGARGPSPTMSQLIPMVREAVNQFCSDNNCKGSKGDPGNSVKGDPGESIKGDTGDTGSAGAKGDKGDTGAKGERGEPGTPGQNGTDAARVTNIACEGSTGVFTFSDSTMFRVDNMCQQPIIPPIVDPVEE